MLKKMSLTNLLNRKKRKSIPQISLCGKLEAIIGNYYLSGAALYDIETLYYDPDVGFYDSIPLSKENIVAYFLKNESIAIVRNDMLNKLKEDTKEYDIMYIPVENFNSELLTKDSIEPLLDILKTLNWIDDDFMNDDTIEFDFEAFEIIDSGIAYLNPKHFSVEQLAIALQSHIE